MGVIHIVIRLLIYLFLGVDQSGKDNICMLNVIKASMGQPVLPYNAVTRVDWSDIHRNTATCQNYV